MMLHDRFLRRLEEQFPFFYARVAEEAAEDAVRIRDGVGGDLEKAIARARFESAGRLWWPYVKGTFGKDRAAMEAFTRLVLTVDQLAGYEPASMDEARAQVLSVLRESLDVEKLRRVLTERRAEGAAAGAAGMLASASALLAPVGAARKAWAFLRWLPDGVLIAMGAVAAAAILSIPLVAGYSAGHHAERAARGARSGGAGSPRDDDEHARVVSS